MRFDVIKQRQLKARGFDDKEKAKAEAKRLTQQFYDEYYAELTSKEREDRKVNKLFNKHRERVCDRIGLELFVLYSVNKKMSNNKEKKKGRDNDWLQERIKHLCDEHKQGILVMMSSKDLKRRKRELSDVESSTSLDQEA